LSSFDCNSVLDKHEWANELVREIEMMNEAVAALQRIGAHRSKWLGRPPKWLREADEANESGVRSAKHKGAEKQAETE
jgi:hypothetical protein